MYAFDKELYPEPPYLAIVLSHRDLNLGYFSYVQHRMKTLLSGSNLNIVEEGLASPSSGELIVKFSNAFKIKLEEYFAKGYRLKSAGINFIVYWKNEEIELKVILPEIYLKK